MHEQVAYQVISDHYEGKIAERSGFPYIKHIDDGLLILNELGATDEIKAAYCLHPIFQCEADPILVINNIVKDDNGGVKRKYATFASVRHDLPYPTELYISPQVQELAEQYTITANSYLSPNCIDSGDYVPVSHLMGVNVMLLADKVQNYADFEANSGMEGPEFKDKRIRLHIYFKNWLRKLAQIGLAYPPSERKLPSHGEY